MTRRTDSASRVSLNAVNSTTSEKTTVTVLRTSVSPAGAGSPAPAGKAEPHCRQNRAGSAVSAPQRPHHAAAAARRSGPEGDHDVAKFGAHVVRGVRDRVDGEGCRERFLRLSRWAGKAGRRGHRGGGQHDAAGDV